MDCSLKKLKYKFKIKYIGKSYEKSKKNMVAIGLFIICLAITNVSALSVDEFNNTSRFNTILEENKLLVLLLILIIFLISV